MFRLLQEGNSVTRGNPTTMGQKVWKTKPHPGPEQVELERMFKNNEIVANATPDSVKRRSDLFKDFSTPVFATHYRKTKAKMGLCGKPETRMKMYFCLHLKFFLQRIYLGHPLLN